MTYSRHAFTIIELLVATSIIGIIAASTFASFAHQRLVARNSQRKDVATTYTKAIGSYEASKGTSFVTEKVAGDTTGCTNASLSSDDGTQFLASAVPTTQCVGLDGRSYGRMSADSTTITGSLIQFGQGNSIDLGGSYYSSDSILKALQTLGFLGTISPDPSLPKSINPNTQVAIAAGLANPTGSEANTPVQSNAADYLLIRCCKDGRESIGTGGSVYAVWTKLETDGSAQANTNSGECGSYSAAKTVVSTYPTAFSSGYTYSFGGGTSASGKLFAPNTSSATVGGNEAADWFAVGNASAQRTVGLADTCHKSA